MTVLIVLYFLLRCYIQPRRDTLEELMDTLEVYQQEYDEQQKRLKADNGNLETVHETEEKKEMEQNKRRKGGEAVVVVSEASEPREQIGEDIRRPGTADSQNSASDHRVVTEMPAKGRALT